MEICINNRPSLIALVGYACENDIDDRLTEWIKRFFTTSATYKLNQKENYIYMLNSFKKGLVA